MKLPALGCVVVLVVGCGSSGSHGTAGGGGQAGSSTSPGTGGTASSSTGGSSASAGTGGAPAGTGGGAGGGTGGAASGGSHATGGATGGVPGGGHGGTTSGGTAGTAGGAGASGACSTATSETDCNARGVCHSVFMDPGNCRCAAVGCCARWASCADGAIAMCIAPPLSCTIQAPHCEGHYVLSYAGGCYEGCVREAACGAGGAGGAGPGGSGSGGSGAGGHGGNGGSGGAGGATGQTCSSEPPIACPGGQICDEDSPNRCSAGSELGHCIVMPGACTTIYAPVCGCDNQTYSNDCERQRARIQLGHTGACS